MKKMKKRKGFTLTELAIVIAVIAILIAVLVPTFVSLINKANESSDSQLAKNMNTLLANEEALGDTPERMEDVNYILTEGGYTISKLSPTAEGNVFVWNYDTNRISYIDSEGTVLYAGDSTLTADGTFTGGNNYWLTVETADEIRTWGKYSLSYYIASDKFEKVTLTFGYAASVDTSTYTVGTISYTGSGTVTVSNAKVGGNNAKVAARESTSSDKAILRGTVGALTVADSTISVTNYASITTATVTSTKAYTESGYTKTLTVNTTTANTVTISSSGVVDKVTAGSGVTLSSVVTNNGYITTTENTGLTNSGNAYTISSYSELANFRDKVNNGATYKGITVSLTADIDLSGRAWVPIGYDSRKNYQSKDSDGNSTYIYFAGTFNGNKHTISGLTNDGFTPTVLREDTYGIGSGQQNNYVYGFFGIVSGATITDLYLTNVNIVFDNKYQLDSAAALVGFVDGGAYIKNCTASGSIEGTDGISGLVGRAYSKQLAATYYDVNGKTGDSITSSNGYFIVIIDCSVNVTITCAEDKAAGILGSTNTGVRYYISGCTVKGSITMTYSGTIYCAGIVTSLNDSGDKSDDARIITGCSSELTITAANSSSPNIKKIVYGNNSDHKVKYNGTAYDITSTTDTSWNTYTA